jgi:tetratricopeptide (TPR) repeat protein
MKRSAVNSIMLVLLLVVASCASNRKAGWDQREETVKLGKKELASTIKLAKDSWDKRADKASLEVALVQYQTLVKAAQTKEEYYKYAVRLCRGYYFLADGHYPESQMAKKMSYWNMGTAWGEKAMATSEEFRSFVSKGGDVTDALKFLDDSYKAAIYWSAVNLGKWAKSSGIATILKYKSRIKTMVAKVLKADAKFFYGAAHRYWGAYYAVAPGFAGGDMSKSKESFEASLKIAPTYLGTLVLYAKLYDVKKGNENEFKAKLKKVLKANPSTIKSIAPENIIEQKKAKLLLTQMDDLF